MAKKLVNLCHYNIGFSIPILEKYRKEITVYLDNVRIILKITGVVWKYFLCWVVRFDNMKSNNKEK